MPDRDLVTTPAAPDDVGERDPALAAALAAYDGSDRAHAVVRTALLAARLLVPTVAVLAEPAASGAEKTAELAVPALVGADGRHALPAFTSYDALRGWRPDARPVPMPGARVVSGAAAEGYDAVVLDVAGPVSYVLDAAALGSLAAAVATADGAPVVVVA